MNRIEKAEEKLGGVLQWSRDYAYDHFGNRWISGNWGHTLHMATPKSQSAIQASTNRLTGAEIVYDNAGNLTAHPHITTGSGSMAYDANNKMKSFTATGVAVTTTYDAAARRVRKVYNSETTVWVYDAFGKLAAEYTTESHTDVATYFRTTDHLGSTRLTTDAVGDVVARRDFFPFGERIDSNLSGRSSVLDGTLVSFNSSPGMRQEFTGQLRDGETGLDYFWERCFCAPLARFFSVDPENAGTRSDRPQSWNAFGYAHNNPMLYVDPDGRDPEGFTFSTTVTELVGFDLFPIWEISDYLVDYGTFDPSYYPLYQIATGPPGTPPGYDVQGRVTNAAQAVANRQNFSANCVDGLSRIGITPDQVINTAGQIDIIDGRYAGSSVGDAFGDPVWGARHQARENQRVGLPPGDDARVWDVFTRPGVGAWTPYLGTAIYIDPTASQHANRSDQEFQALVFHELVHNLTVKGDQNIQDALNITVQTDSTNITDWFLLNCISGPDNY